MRLKTSPFIYLNFFILIFFIALSGLPGRTEEGTPIQDIERYFPDEIGMTWTYRGSVADQVQRVGAYTNIASVKGTAEKKGVQVKIFAETNQANDGPAESYFVRDKEGITYHGGDPTTPFESQIVPYRVIHFPIVLNGTFSQIEKSGLAFGRDLDNDGKDEETDVSARITAVSLETVSTPAGTFKNCLKLQGTMTLQIALSGSGKVVQLTDTTTNWFAPEVGMVKGTEKTEFPSIEGRGGQGILITEELTEYSKEKSSLH